MSQTLHQELVKLQRQAKTWLAVGCAEGFDPRIGICDQVQLNWSDKALLIDLNSVWPSGTNKKTHPVPHPNDNPVSAYVTAGEQAMWNPQYQYARNRWALLGWLIEQTASEADQ